MLFFFFSNPTRMGSKIGTRLSETGVPAIPLIIILAEIKSVSAGEVSWHNILRSFGQLTPYPNYVYTNIHIYPSQSAFSAKITTPHTPNINFFLFFPSYFAYLKKSPKNSAIIDLGHFSVKKSAKIYISRSTSGD